MKMIRHFTLLRFLSSLCLWLIPPVLGAREPQIEVQQILQTTHRGFTTDEPVELVVFYAGQVGLPITINEE
jgi:hypothetical protein